MLEVGFETTGLFNGHGSNFGSRTSSNGRAVCNCCPYGYHIDLGFVEFCDRLTKEHKETSSKTERRERRRQRKSMDVLLGISNPLFWNIQQLLPTLYLNQKQKKKAVVPEIKKGDLQNDVSNMKRSPPEPPPRGGIAFISENDGLSRAVRDFEATLKRTSHPLSKHQHGEEFIPKLVDEKTTIPVEDYQPKKVVETIQGDAEELRKISTPVLNASPASNIPLQTIRDQMAISLEKMKEMENKIKVLPSYESKISSLEKENRDLTMKVTELTHSLVQKQRVLEKFEKNAKRQALEIEKYAEIEEVQCKQLEIYEAERLKPEKKVPSREVGTLCVASTRDVGTSGTYQAKSVYTETAKIAKTDRATATDLLAEEKPTKRLSLKDLEIKECRTFTKSTQTSVAELSPKIEKRDVGEQSEKVLFREVGINAKPKTVDSSVDTKISMKDASSSEDCINDLLCDKCRNIETKSVGVGYGNVKAPLSTPGVGLANRSKSFDLSSKKQTRSIGVSTVPPVKKLTATKQVGTIDVIIQKKNVSVNTLPKSTKSISTSAEIQTECEKCSKQEANKSRAEADTLSRHENKVETKDLNIEGTKKESSSKEFPHASKIPRPTGTKTPVMSRKFIRQDTYSASQADSVTPSQDISKLDTSSEVQSLPPSTEEVQVTLRKKKPVSTAEYSLSDIEKRFSAGVTLDEKRDSLASSSADRYSGFFDDSTYDFDQQYDAESNRNSHVFPDSALFQPIQDKQREKLVPSKEMKAAMKVVNDSLHKHPNSLPKHLKTASGIIQQEWFKVSSTASANPLDVEDYLDSFEEVSNTLLEYVVNMIDNNGNTAMHYAVSHGNFDVVSILLDSKVCNINKANAAGYTCVMLVSLAQVRSDTHREVVRRLFLLADVNIRAKQHGQTALMLAVSHGRLDMVQLLLDAGADPNIQDVDGSTALMCAAEHGHLEIVKQILTHPDCDPSIVDCDGCSALAIAMEAGNRDIGVLLYAREHFAPGSRGSSPYVSFKKRTKTGTSPHLKTSTSPGPKKSDRSSY